MTNFEIIDNGLINTMNQYTTIVIHSLCALMVVLSAIWTIFCIICAIRGDENPVICTVTAFLCVFFLLFSIWTPFATKEDNLIQTYKVKPTGDATVENMLDFTTKYGIITKENDWYIVYEK